MRRGCVQRCRALADLFARGCRRTEGNRMRFRLFSIQSDGEGISGRSSEKHLQRSRLLVSSAAFLASLEAPISSRCKQMERICFVGGFHYDGFDARAPCAEPACLARNCFQREIVSSAKLFSTSGFYPRGNSCIWPSTTAHLDFAPRVSGIHR